MLHFRPSYAEIVIVPHQLAAAAGVAFLRDGGFANVAMIFARHALHGIPLQAAITAPRSRLGRTCGAATTNAQTEDRHNPDVIRHL